MRQIPLSVIILISIVVSSSYYGICPLRIPRTAPVSQEHLMITKLVWLCTKLTKRVWIFTMTLELNIKLCVKSLASAPHYCFYNIRTWPGIAPSFSAGLNIYTHFFIRTSNLGTETGRFWIILLYHLMALMMWKLFWNTEIEIGLWKFWLPKLRKYYSSSCWKAKTSLAFTFHTQTYTTSKLVL